MARKPPSGGATQEAPATSGESSTTPNHFKSVFEGIRAGDRDSVRAAIADRIERTLEQHGLGNYKFLILYDEVDSISNFHADALYAAASAEEVDKQILLLLNSRGGRIEPAYLISKTLKRLARDKFVAVIPRRAKSAATLIALGADEIHMGLISELGPIDPQLGGLPALALGNALNIIADLVCKFPASAALFNQYISDQVPIRVLGYYERINESAVQYAERLLQGKTLGSRGDAHSTAEHLVNHYKDHSFVIDFEEAKDLLGGMIKDNTPEYRAADSIFQFLDMVSFVCGIEKKKMWVVGDASGFAWKDDDQTEN